MAELIKYALKKDTNEIVHIDKVANGLACECICPHCKESLVARHGNIREHSFAHAKGVTDCGLASMTMLHLMAQKIIEEEKYVKLPCFSGPHLSFRKPENGEAFDNVVLEKRDTITNRRPDCECSRSTTSSDQISTLWVEIRVSHKVDVLKSEEIKKQDIDCVEIDLQQFIGKDYSEEELRQFIQNDASKTTWINPATYIKEDERLFNEHTVDWDPTTSHYVKGLPNFPRPGSMPQKDYCMQTLQCLDIYYKSGFYDSDPAYYREKKALYEKLLKTCY